MWPNMCTRVARVSTDIAVAATVSEELSKQRFHRPHECRPAHKVPSRTPESREVPSLRVRAAHADGDAGSGGQRRHNVHHPPRRAQGAEGIAQQAPTSPLARMWHREAVAHADDRRQSWHETCCAAPHNRNTQNSDHNHITTHARGDQATGKTPSPTHMHERKLGHLRPTPSKTP